MVQLGCNYSLPLRALLAAGEVEVDWIKLSREDPFAYGEALPLDRAREIHVTGPRLEDGVMQDSHAELREEDYALTAWLLRRTAPLVLTLEYGGTGPHYQQPGMSDPDALRRQLHRLKGMLA